MLFLANAPSWFWQPSSIHGIALFEVVLFAALGLLGCAIAPTTPFKSAFSGVLGVFTGIVADVFVHPTVGGHERNLFPLEVAFHTFTAIIGFGGIALAWKVGARLVRARTDA